MIRRISFWLAWHGLAALAIIILPLKLRFGTFAAVSADAQAFAMGAAIVYLVTAVALTFKHHFAGALRVSDVVAVGGTCVGGLFLLLNLHQPVYSRSIVLMSVTLLSGFGLFSLVLILMPSVRKAALPLAAGAVLVSGLPTLREPERVQERIISTALYDLVARTVRNPFESQKVTGGGLSIFGDRVLLATGDGRLYVLRWDSGSGTLETRLLVHRVPLNQEMFAAGNPNDAFLIGTFRTADILVQDFGHDFRLLASHHFWNEEQKCFTVRVSATEGSYAAFTDADEPHAWTVVYESEPCLPFTPGDLFGGHQIGGKLQLLDDHRLLLALGDHERDGVMSEDVVSQDESTSYGKTVLVDLSTGATSLHTLGHRNPQGLHIDARGNVWSTEHGPQGGDELNLIVEGRNYGWPLVTYGTNYGGRPWPMSSHSGRHDGFEKPVYAWVPSIGISNLISVRSGLFEAWNDDLLVAALGDKALWRVRMDQHRVVSMERIGIGERIRDLVTDHEGRLILWTEGSITPPTSGAVIIVEPVLRSNGTAPVSLTSRTLRGEALFAQCVGCHGMAGGVAAGLAPTLGGVVGRRVAAVPGYTYSAALGEMSGSWTEDRLDAFLADPTRFAPGTLMRSEGVADAEERSDLIEYLKTLR
jgi:aldose sugar dehydrogenase